LQTTWLNDGRDFVTLPRWQMARAKDLSWFSILRLTAEHRGELYHFAR
jgi:hypothetical protein